MQFLEGKNTEEKTLQGHRKCSCLPSILCSKWWIYTLAFCVKLNRLVGRVMIYITSILLNDALSCHHPQFLSHLFPFDNFITFRPQVIYQIQLSFRDRDAVTFHSTHLLQMNRKLSLDFSYPYKYVFFSMPTIFSACLISDIFWKIKRVLVN